MASVTNIKGALNARVCTQLNSSVNSTHVLELMCMLSEGYSPLSVTSHVHATVNNEEESV